MGAEQTANYYGFQFPRGAAVFIGRKKEEIKKTIQHYVDIGREEEIYIPNDEEIHELLEVNITVAFPIAHVDHNIHAEVRPRFFFHVNANAFDYIRDVGRNYSTLKRGDLYKFSPGLDILGLWFLPEDVMQGLRDYEWTQHISQIDQWLGKRESVIAEGIARGHLRRL